MTFAHRTYSLTRKYLDEYKYYEYFMTKQFCKFLDNNRCKFLFDLILKYNVSIYSEYLTFVYGRICVNVFGQYFSTTINNQIYSVLSRKIHFYYLTSTEHVTILYKILKDLPKSISLYLNAVPNTFNTYEGPYIGIWRRIEIIPFEMNKIYSKKKIENNDAKIKIYSKYDDIHEAKNRNKIKKLNRNNKTFRY